MQKISRIVHYVSSKYMYMLSNVCWFFDVVMFECNIKLKKCEACAFKVGNFCATKTNVFIHDES